MSPPHPTSLGSWIDVGGWTGALLCAWLVDRARRRATRPPSKHGLPLLLLAFGSLHHLLGHLAAWRLWDARPESLEEASPLLRLCAIFRPSATAIRFHQAMDRVTGGWWILPRLPDVHTYHILAGIESAVFAGALLVVATYVFRPPRAGGDLDGPRDTARLIPWVVGAGMAGVATGGVHLAAQVQAVFPWGSMIPVELELLLVVPIVGPLALAAPSALVVAGAGALGSRERRHRGLRAALAILTFWAVVLSFAWGADALRLRGFARAAARARPLVAAIEAHEDERGEAPGTLRGLVPGYARSIPGTGMGAYPEFRLESPGGRGWWLFVPCPSGRLGFEWLTFRSGRGLAPQPEPDDSIPVAEGWVLTR